MDARLQKWGNSVGVRIPHVILKELNLKINDLISVMMLTNACIEE